MFYTNPGGIHHIMPIVSRPSRFIIVGTRCSANPWKFVSAKKGQMASA
jgi:hypothetical protein